MVQAKNAAVAQCGFGIVFDIHGHIKNDYNQLGYRLSDYDLQQRSLNSFNNEADECSIHSLADNNVQGDTLDEIVRGNMSLGTIMESDFGYLMVPSSDHPYLDQEYYYQGGFGMFRIIVVCFVEVHFDYIALTGIITHGSLEGGTVDAIQIEVNRENRWNETKRDQFCIDFSRAIDEFVDYYYDLSSCTGVAANIGGGVMDKDNPKPVQLMIPKQPFSESDYYRYSSRYLNEIDLSSGWIMGIAALLVIILVINIAFMIYFNCCKKRKRLNENWL